MSAPVKNLPLLPILLALGFSLRLGYGLLRPPQKPGQAISNADCYVEIAASVADSWSLQEAGRPSARREPVYPVLLGLLFKAFGKSYAVVLLANCGLAVAALYLLFLVGRDLFGETVALLATLVSAAYPWFVFYAAQTVRETAMLAFSALCIWTLNRALKDPGVRAFAWAGLAGALCALTNITFLLFALILAPLAIIWLNRQAWAAALRWSGVYTLVLVLLYAVWPLRNYLAFKAWIPGTTIGIGAIWYSYLIVPQQLGGTPLETEILQKDPVVQAAAKLPEEAARDKFLFQASLDWIKRHPLSYLRLVAWRFFWDEWRFWPRPQACGRDYRAMRWIGLLSNGWIIPLGFVGMAMAWRKPRRGLCLYLFIFSIVATYSLILTMLRYRTPIMPWMILFACLAICRFRERRTAAL